MARNWPNGRIISLLEGSGIKVGCDGHLSDWQDKPPRNARPLSDVLQSGDERHAQRTAFLEHEDDLIKLWWHTAKREGISSGQIFEDLETVVSFPDLCSFATDQAQSQLPSHPRQAYDSRWRKTLQNHDPPPLVFDEPFQGLIRTTAGRNCSADEPSDLHCPEARLSLEHDRISIHEHTANTRLQVQDLVEVEDLNGRYSDHRIESDVNLYAKLEIDQESQLRDLLRCSWLVHLYKELREAGQMSNWMLKQASSDYDLNAEVLQLPVSKSAHVWKLNQAVAVLELPETISSRYRSAEQDRSYFSEDDYDLRFIVRASYRACARGQIWEGEHRGINGWRGPATKALWLLIWLKWVHKKTNGKERESLRLQEKRLRWLTFLDTQLRRLARIQPNSAGSAQRERRLDVDRQRFLISDQARSLYNNSRDQRLASWGLSSSYSGTCVLLPAKWAYTTPATLAEDPSSWRLDEKKESRLQFSLGAFCFAWGRAAAWFETWPRDLQELQNMLSVDPDQKVVSSFHGSHLCHHGLCILPTHLCYESDRLNYDRIACAIAARQFRVYGTPIPEHCVHHNPPCLLQLAALTTFEAIAIQFNVLRLARNLSAVAPMARPEHHPANYTTFEQGPVLSHNFPSVQIQLERLVRLPVERGFLIARGFERTCIFCTTRLTFSVMTNFWAHLRFVHGDGDRGAILKEVRESSEAYLAWADEHFYNYEQVNSKTWQKCMQAQAPGFDWEMFTQWRLNKEKLLKGKNAWPMPSELDQEPRANFD